MARRVIVGCRDCKDCGGGVVRVTAGLTVGLSVAAATGGLSLLLPKKKCGQCKHSMRVHTGS